jgi:hypothetical protein
MKKDIEEFEEIPKYEKEEFFILSLGVSTEEKEEFFNNLVNILRDVGVSYTRNLAKEYYNVLQKFNGDYKKAKKEFEKKILFSN